jgi:NitT/TauT family transport system permease protein
VSQRFDPLLLAIFLFVAWQAMAVLVGPEGLATPVVTLRTLLQFWGDETFWANMAATGRAFLLALAISLSFGVVIGLLLGISRLAGEIADPLLNTLYSIPKITLYPVILLVFGLGMSAKVAFGTLHAIFPVILLTMNGVRAIRRVHLRTSRALRLSPLQTLVRVVLPSTLPEIFTGMRIGVALALLGTLLGEFFASDRGIGYALTQYVSRNDVPGITALTVLLFAAASLGGLGLLAVDRRLHHQSSGGSK